MTWADLAALAESSRLRTEAWRCSKAGRIHREEMRRRDERDESYWREIDRGQPARSVGGRGYPTSISAGAYSAGRT